MLRYKSDLNIDANGGQGKIIFRASKIECPCVITSPNIEHMNAQLNALTAAMASTAATSGTCGPISTTVLPHDAEILDRIRVEFVSLRARQDELEASRVELEDKIARSSPSNDYTILSDRINSLADEVAKLSSVVERIEKSLSSASGVAAVCVHRPPVESAAPEVAATSHPTCTTTVDVCDDVKRIVTPDGRMIALRRTPQTTKNIQYAW
jgi:hypothetical protein